MTDEDDLENVVKVLNNHNLCLTAFKKELDNLKNDISEINDQITSLYFILDSCDVYNSKRNFNVIREFLRETKNDLYKDIILESMETIH